MSWWPGMTAWQKRQEKKRGEKKYAPLTPDYVRGMAQLRKEYEQHVAYDQFKRAKYEEERDKYEQEQKQLAIRNSYLHSKRTSQAYDSGYSANTQELKEEIKRQHDLMDQQRAVMQHMVDLKNLRITTSPVASASVILPPDSMVKDRQELAFNYKKKRKKKNLVGKGAIAHIPEEMI